MSKQIARRTSDCVIEQWGENIADRAGCVTEDITDEQYEALRTRFASPNGGIVANADGTFTARPAPVAPPPDPQIATDKNTVTAFMNAASGSATAVQRDDVIKALIRYLRRQGQDA